MRQAKSTLARVQGDLVAIHVCVLAGCINTVGKKYYIGLLRKHDEPDARTATSKNLLIPVIL